MSIEAANPTINATLTASAGSGKTWMLVTRIVRLLMDGAESGTILALTFTRKAAAEMQQRLGERLYEMAIADDEQLNNLLTEIGLEHSTQHIQIARALYEKHQYCDYAVRTQTFHSFCQDILSRFSLEADVPPNFDLLESSSLLIQQAKDALFNEAAKDMDGDLAHKLQQLMQASGGLHNLNKVLDSFLNHRSDWWAFTESETDASEFANNRLAQQLEFDPQLDPVKEFFTHNNIQMITSFAQLLCKTSSKKNQQAGDTLAILIADKSYDSQTFHTIIGCFLTQKNTVIVQGRKDTASLRKSLKDEADTFLEINQIIPSRILDTIDLINKQDTFKLNTLWYSCGERLTEHYQNLKQQLRLLDFVDLEWHTYKLLKSADNAEWIQYKLDQRLKHFLIDEFQDTNPTQWQLILPLLEEMAASENTDRSVFLVGDEKQSIYSFRRAKPELQSQASDWLQKNLQAKAFPLNKSWRSSAVIIDAVNQVFSGTQYHALMSEFKTHQTHQDTLYGQLVIMPCIRFIKEDKKEAENSPLVLRNPLVQAQTEKASLYLQEGQQIASAIQQLINDKTTTGEGKNCRLINYDDIYILVRKRSHVAAYEQALQEAGIDFIGANKGTFLDCLEIQDMLALLDSLISPFNNLSLAQVLKSPLFSASDNDLMRLAAIEKPSLWIDRLETAQEDLDKTQVLSRAFIYLKEWRKLADQIPVHDLLDKIYHQAQVLKRYKAASSDSLKPRVEANLIRFMELALELDSGRYPSLMHFLQYLRSLKSLAQDAPDEAPAEQAASRVKIMTIHASKGLEAAVVFLADTIGIQKDKSSLSTLIDWPVEKAKPQAFQLIPSSKKRDSFSAEQVEKQQQMHNREDANLLYVAMTRAKQYLFISACQPEKGPLNDWYNNIKNALIDGAEGNAVEDDNAQLIFKSSSAMPTANHIKESRSPSNTVIFDERLLKPIQYKTASLVIAPSQSKSLDENTHINIEKNNDMDEDSLQRGIAIHRCLELLNINRAITDETLKQIICDELKLSNSDIQVNEYLQESRQLINKLNLKDIFEPNNALNTFNELPMQYAQKNKMVYGIIDRLIVTENKVWIIDYKTHQHTDEKILQKIAESYQQQMQYYANGLKKAWPDKTIQCSLLFTHSGLLVNIPTSQK